MHRARQLAVATVAALLSFAPSASAFHAGRAFAVSASGGGGGGLYYTGAPAERRWDCTACHLDPPGRIRAELAATPPFGADGYSPGASYQITVKLVGAYLGRDHPANDTNGMTLAIVDEAGQQAGAITELAPDELIGGGPATIASTGDVLGATSWSFTWRAPDAPRGRVTFHVAVVDGDGAATSPAGTFGDPWGDDVAVVRVPIEPMAGGGVAHGSAFGAGLVVTFGFVVRWCARFRDRARARRRPRRG